MAPRPVVISVICIGLFLILESFIPTTMALRTSNINDYRMENQKTHKRNYMMQRARDKEILGNLDNIVGVGYDAVSSDPGRTPEDLSAFIVDYANMIDDVFLLDKSVETRTRKRGNIKLEKYSDQSILDSPCSCNSTILLKSLGDNTFPRYAVKKICGNEHGCVLPYVCQEISYEMPVLRRKTSYNSISSRITLIPGNLNTTWAAEYESISVGCKCTRDYTEQ